MVALTSRSCNQPEHHSSDSEQYIFGIYSARDSCKFTELQGFRFPEEIISHKNTL